MEGIPLEKVTEPKLNNLRAALTVGCRLLAKFLAILNAGIIVFGCIFEFAGFYESCFCKSDYLGLRGNAYLSFLSTEESAEIARPYWYAGSGMAMFAVLLSCLGYFTRVHKLN